MSDGSNDGHDSTQLVVIGSSAGGVEALLTLVGDLPADFPAPIVVAQHLDPRRPSQLQRILANRTQLTVRTVTDSDQLQSGTIYLVPADRDVEISDHHVDILQDVSGTPKPSVDRLMATAAQIFGDRLISVVLSGTGSDGTAGAQATKAYGGTVIIQNPETARFPGMPGSVALASVDIVANLEAIGPLLVDLVTGTYVRSAPEGDGLQAFLEQVRERTGLDFSAYKRPTVTRRLQRRMAAVGRDTLEEYHHYIDRNPEELRQLVATFLIKVTEFFRDPELFDYLRETVIPALIVEARERGELRIWSAGCATGEEAYSLAMIVADLLEDEIETLPVRIFATDVAVDAVDFARRGVYPASALAHLPPDLIERHFTALDGVYEVRKSVRSLVIFGDHDLARRAPFPRIDLVLCRNVLIYFATELQRRALQLFAYSLRSGGYLALGKSESVSPLPEYFALEHSRLKVYRRLSTKVPHAATPLLDTSIPERAMGALATHARARGAALIPQPLAVPALGERRDHLFDTLTVGIVTVKRNYDVVSINAAARLLLGITTGAIGEDLVHAVNPSLAASIRTGVDAALRGETTTTLQQLPPDVIERAGRDLSITSSALRQDEAPSHNAAVLVEVIDITPLARRQRELAQEHEQLQTDHATLLEQATSAANELRELRTINQTMAAEDARLRMEVELIQVAHEEAQAAAEEIETLNEEQQATNEELETVNEEMQATVEELHATIGELSATNHELQTRTKQLEEMAAAVEEQRRIGEAERSRLSAILANMGDAVLVVNEQGETVLTNAAFGEMFGSPSDLVPLDDAGNPLPRDRWPQLRAAEGEAFTLAFSLMSPDGLQRSFESNAQPVTGDDYQHWGIIVFRDITERSLRRQQEQFLAVAAHELRTPLTVLSGRLQLLARRLAQTSTDPRLEEHTARALEQARNLEGDIDELMEAARLQFGKIDIDRAPVDLVAIVTRAVEMARTLSAGQEIAVTTPDAPTMMLGDERRLVRVVLNVLTNAIVYAPGTERIDIRLTTNGEHATIEIEDRGPGIAAEALPQIFSRFVRLEQGPTSRGGLGLGLFIAREIVEAHGGTIEARSMLGEGTTMVIELPLLGAVTTGPDGGGDVPEELSGSPL